MKVLHFADVHCRDRDIEEIEKCLNFIVEIARAETPDIIINAGDTFDSAGIKADSLSAKLIFKIFKELADIAPVAIIIGTPSHDGRVAETLSYINARYPVHVATRPEQIYLCKGRLSVDSSMPGILMDVPIEAVISLCPAPTKQFFQTDSGILDSDSEIAAEMSKMFMGFAAQAAEYVCPHVLVGHWQTDGAFISETQTLTGIDISISKEQMALGNFDLICLGHLHEKQRFYSGSITGLNWGELSDKGFYIHTLEGKKLIETRFIKTPSRKLIKLSEDLTNVQELTDVLGIPLMGMLLAGDAPVDVKDAVVRVEFKVFQDEATKINTDEIKASLISSGAKEADIRLIRIPRENIRSQKILKLTTLREKLIEMAALKNETVPTSILEKANMLESEEADKIVREVAN
jgi:DNA repair exonuclease SbcCD nuclease subunit